MYVPDGKAVCSEDMVQQNWKFCLVHLNIYMGSSYDFVNNNKDDGDSNSDSKESSSLHLGQVHNR